MLFEIICHSSQCILHVKFYYNPTLTFSGVVCNSRFTFLSAMKYNPILPIHLGQKFVASKECVLRAHYETKGNQKKSNKPTC